MRLFQELLDGSDVLLVLGWLLFGRDSSVPPQKELHRNPWESESPCCNVVLGGSWDPASMSQSGTQNKVVR